MFFSCLLIFSSLHLGWFYGVFPPLHFLSSVAFSIAFITAFMTIEDPYARRYDIARETALSHHSEWRVKAFGALTAAASNSGKVITVH
jgi:hypothetical protein